LLQLNEGSGSILVVAVGVNTEYGKTMSLVMTEAASTPLQEHLEVLAASIGKVGFVVAVICFIVLLIRCAGLWDVSAAVALPMLSIGHGFMSFIVIHNSCSLFRLPTSNQHLTSTSGTTLPTCIPACCS